MGRDPVARDAEAYREDMIRAADLIRGFIRGVTRAKFDTDLLIRSAVERQLGIIGEGAACFPEWARRQYPSIPWKAIAAFRQIVVHQYWFVDLDEAWAAATKDAPTLAKALSAKILKKPSAQLEAEIAQVLRPKKTKK